MMDIPAPLKPMSRTDARDWSEYLTENERATVSYLRLLGPRSVLAHPRWSFSEGRRPVWWDGPLDAALAMFLNTVTVEDMSGWEQRLYTKQLASSSNHNEGKVA